jgi:NhaP-type Na+/H+ or K+/H+ antiporter
VLSWAGTRGVISLAAIFTVPLTTSGGQPFPGRDLLLFCTFLVVMVTLLGQGLTFGLVARLLGVRADRADEAALRWEARHAAVRAGLARLDELASDGELSGAALAALRASLEHEAGHDGEPECLAADHDAALRARRDVIDAQREELLRLRDAGHLPDSSLRVLERELDHEERTLPPHDGH